MGCVVIHCSENVKSLQKERQKLLNVFLRKTVVKAPKATGNTLKKFVVFNFVSIQHQSGDMGTVIIATGYQMYKNQQQSAMLKRASIVNIKCLIL